MKTTSSLSKVIPFVVIAFIFVLDFYFSWDYLGILYVIPTYLYSRNYSKGVTTASAILSILLVIVAHFISSNGGKLVDLPELRIASILFIVSHFIIVLNVNRISSYLLSEQILINQSKKITEELSEHANILLDKNAIIRGWNAKANEIFGLKKKEVIGKHISFLSSEKKEVERTLHKLISTLGDKDKTVSNLWLKRNNGSLFWSEIKLSLIHNSSGKSIGVIVLVKDIDNQRSLEQLLTVTNSLARVGGWEYDLVSDQLFWSKTTKDIHEVPQDFVPTAEAGINFYLEGDDRNKISQVFNHMIETGEPFEEELRIITAKKNIRWIRTKAYPIIVNGVCKKIYGSFQDIHESKERDLELRKSQDKFEKIFKYSPYGIGRANLKGQILEGNKSYYELVGYNQQELEQLTIKDLTHPDDVSKDIEMFSKLNNGEVENFELDKRIFRKGGDLRWVSVAASRITNKEGETDYFIAQLNDITEKKLTERKLLEQQQQLIEKNKELNQYAHITSHDLQEPVRTIHSFSSLLQEQYEELIDDTGKKYLRFIHEASQRLSNQIKGLLDYNRLGKLESKMENIDLNKILNYVTADLATLISENKASVNIEKLPSINVYPTEIKLLFQNLISNAIKFQSNETPPIISIEVKEETNEWQFTVEDNGIGIEEKFHDKIFQIFQRLHNRNQYSGSGIGLAHCKKIVELHKGNIWIESEPSKGSKFFFTISKGL